MKKLFCILCLIASYLLYDISFEKSNTVIIYSSMEQYRCDELQKQLENKFPNNEILVMYVSTAKSAAKIKTEKEGTDADIVVGLETAYLEKIKDSLAEVKNVKTQDYLDGFDLEDNDYKYVIWEKQAGSFVVNNDIISKLGLETPKTYEDLLDPQYKGLIAMPDPKTSGTGYFFYKSVLNELGEEKGLEYFESLQKNIKSFTESGSGPIKLLIQGEIAIGLGLTFQAVEQVNADSPFTVITPDFGSPYNLTGTALIKGRENNTEILEIYEYIVNDFLLYDKIHYSPEIILENQEIIIENYPENIVYADMSGISDIDEKERLLSLWKY